ncbi:DNA damage-inducible protein 1, partial [Coemansia sp. Benny D115]
MSLDLELECSVAGTSAEWDNDWHIASLFIIIGTSAAGVFLPIISQSMRPSQDGPARTGFAIQLGQFFGAGVIIATAFVHVFPAANTALTNPCLGKFADKYGAWASLIAMAAVFTMHSVEWWLVEAWLSRTGAQKRKRSSGHRRLLRMIRGRYSGKKYSSDSSDDDDGSRRGGNNDDDDDDPDLFPAYSRAFNASRMMLPPPVLSPPVNPYAFGASTVSPNSHAAGGRRSALSAYTGAPTGFALSKYGNYAAVVQSRQHLAMISSDQVSRYLRSEPQFPLYAASLWPAPPPLPTDLSMHMALGMCGKSQAKSTPELMRRRPKSTRNSNVSAGAPLPGYMMGGSSSNGVSLRQNSFSNRNRRRARRRSQRSAGVFGSKHRCLSMPRLPPTTLAAAMCDSLLEPIQNVSNNEASVGSSEYKSSPMRSSCSVSSSFSQNPEYHNQQQDKKQLQHQQKSMSAKDLTGRRHSLHAITVTRNARASMGDSHEASIRLDTVPETEDSQTMPTPYGSVGTGRSVPPPPLSASLKTSIGSRTTTYQTARAHKRVSIPTPPIPPFSAGGAIQPQPQSQPQSMPLTQSAMQSSRYLPSANSERQSTGRFGPSMGSSAYWQYNQYQQLRAQSHLPIQPSEQHIVPIQTLDAHGKPLAGLGEEGESEQDSTAIHSRRSSMLARPNFPVDVKQRALATYVLELGIALYSVLVGLALAMSDHGFAALFIAVCFHQFFEGLALGTSLSELYWIKAQIAAHNNALRLAAATETAAAVVAAAAAAAACEQQELANLEADPFNIESQRRIEEMIQEENIMRNMETALELNPESFATVTMLFIDVIVNGTPIKALVDSGAQATVMSHSCAERCGIMRLVDKRFAGEARGVGRAKILGRVHNAEMQLGGMTLLCSFTVMEGAHISLLFGLDMLKRHLACIDLKRNALVIGDNVIEFLPEHLIPKDLDDDNPAKQPIPSQSSAPIATITPPAP